MRSEYLGQTRQTKVYLTDSGYRDSILYDDLIVVDRRTYAAYFRGIVVGSLAHNKESFDHFEEDLFYSLKKDTYKKKKEESVEKKPKKKQEVKVAAVEYDSSNLVDAALGSVRTFGEQVMEELRKSFEEMTKDMEL